jgi:3'-5' exoribonuclease
MKPAYVRDLAADQTVTSFFLVCEKEIRTGTSGKPYLRLELGDRTGTIEARMWDNFDEPAATFSRDDFVKVQGRVDLFRGRPQLIVERVRRAEPGEVEPADYFPHTSEDVERLYAQLREHVAAVGHPWLRRLLESVVDDPALVPKLKRAPAAKSMHHAYLGGLLEHVVSLCGLCRAVAAHYPEVDADLLLAGAVLHDLGKVDELGYERSLGYTTEGQLLGHIVLELELVTKKMGALEGFPHELKTVIQHLLISHHGRYEFGSPRLPMFREAVLLHYLDDLDSKMAAMRATLAVDKGEGAWTAWNPALERRLLRLDEYLRGAAAPKDGPEQLRLEPPAKED